MNIMTIVGILLIVLGVVGVVYGSISYTSREHVVDVGPLHLNADEEHRLPISPIAGGLAIALGAVLVYYGRRRPASGAIA